MKYIKTDACILHTAILYTEVYHLYLLQVKMKRPVLQGTQVEIIRSGQFYTVLLGKDISLSWDKGTHLLVHISSTYRVLISKHYCELVKYFFPPFTVFYIKYVPFCLFVHGMLFRTGCVVCVVTLMGMSTMTWWAVTTNWRWTRPTLGIPGRSFPAVQM